MHCSARGSESGCRPSIALRLRGLSGLALAALVLLVAAGCSSNKDGNGASGVNDNTKDQIAVDRSDAKFESAKEPALTAETHFAAGQLADVQGSFDRAIVQ